MKICFNGCSYTYGEGFLDHERHLYNFDYIVSDDLGAQRKNIASRGSSNLLIFQRSADEIINGNNDIIFNQWTCLNRVWFSPSPETFVFSNQESDYYSFNDFKINLKKFKEILKIINHDYQNIIDLCNYIQILDKLSDLTGKKVYHINGILPWKEDLIAQYDKSNLEMSLSDYTKNILDFDNRADEEIIMFFENLKAEFLKINMDRWVNIFDSWDDNLLDKGTVGHHPGIKSNQYIANKIIRFLNDRI